jgi:hypothetical protein
MSMPGGCGDPDCSASTSVLDFPTFGKGDLDYNGFWEHGCYECARAWERLHPEHAPCWPFTKEQRRQLNAAFESRTSETF